MSFAYGLSLNVMGFGQGIWLWVCLLVILGFVIIHAFATGQVVSGKERFSTATPGVGLLAMIGGGIAILLKGSDVAFWAIPLLSLAGFAGMFWFLSRYGKFHYPKQ